MSEATTAQARRSQLQLLRWLAERPRSYEETVAAWRSTCPRLSVWEDALLDGLVALRADGTVAPTEAGRAALREDPA